MNDEDATQTPDGTVDGEATSEGSRDAAAAKRPAPRPRSTSAQTRPRTPRGTASRSKSPEAAKSRPARRASAKTSPASQPSASQSPVEPAEKPAAPGRRAAATIAAAEPAMRDSSDSAGSATSEAAMILADVPEPIEVQANDAAAAAELPADRYINRELSWLQFNRRVLEESQNAVPSAARAGSLPVDLGRQSRRVLHGPRRRSRGQVREKIPVRSIDGLTPQEQLDRILEEVDPAAGGPAGLAGRTDEGAAGREDHDRRRRRSEGRGQAPGCRSMFDERIFPILTPLSIDPAHPFPFIPNLGFSIALSLERERDSNRDERAAAPARGAAALHRDAADGGGRRALRAAGERRRAVHRQALPRLPGEGRRHLPHHPRLATSRSRKRPRIWSACSRAR